MKIWSMLAESTKKRYKRSGVTPQRYNAWVKTGKTGKERLAAKGVSREEFLHSPSTKTASRNATEQRVLDRLMTILPRPNRVSLTRGLGTLTGNELYRALTMDADKFRRMASKPPDRENSSGRLINPYWYR